MRSCSAICGRCSPWLASGKLCGECQRLVVALRDNAVLTWQYCHNLVPSNRILLLPSCVCVSVASCASFCSNSRAL